MNLAFGADWRMFDMIDVIQMSKISKHYLLEYQTLLDSYEMQAPNVTSGFRVLDFSDDISDVDYTSDDWSFNESYSESSREMTNSMRTKLLANPPEYSVCAGSKPLSIIIRRCNTPTGVCPSPVHKTKEKSHCRTVNSLSPVHCVDGLFICPAEEDTCDSGVPEKAAKVSVCEYTNTVNLCHKSNELQERTSVEFDRCSETTLTKNSSEEFPPVFIDAECGTENNENNIVDSQNQLEKSVCKVVVSPSPFELVPCLEEQCSENNDPPSPLTKDDGETISDCKIEGLAGLHLSVCETLETSEHSSSVVTSNNCSNNVQSHTVEMTKLFSPSKEVRNAFPVNESLSFNNATCDENRAKCSDSESDLEVTCLTSSLFGECSNQATDESNITELCGGRQNVVCSTEGFNIQPLEDLNNWRQFNCSPLLFSSDDESSSFTEEVNRGIEAALAPSPQHDSMVDYEKRRVGKLQELLMGAPPPPNITIPLFSASEILQGLKDNALWAFTDTMDSIKSTSTAQWTVEAVTTVWPHARRLMFPDIHYNHGTVSEQFEALCQKLLARCVGSETASSVTVWSSFTLPAPRKERRSLPSRHGLGAPTGLSPGRRLSHLARRHRTFSSASLLADGSRLHSSLPHAVPERRTILVESK